MVITEDLPKIEVSFIFMIRKGLCLDLFLSEHHGVNKRAPYLSPHFVSKNTHTDLVLWCGIIFHRLLIDSVHSRAKKKQPRSLNV